MPSPAPLIHIGYHKTGSTWLQDLVFNEARLGLCAPFDKAFIKSTLISPNPLYFDSKACLKQFESGLKTVSAGQVPVISVERICGAIYSNGWDSKEIANRVHQTFPQARILMVIREQNDMLLSTYKHYIKSGCGVTSLSKFLTAAPTTEKLPIFDPIRFEYHYLIDYYQKLFGTENVMVLPYELLRQDPISYIQEIVSHSHGYQPQSLQTALDIAPPNQIVNKGISALAAHIKRGINRLCVYDAAFNPRPLLPLYIDNNRIKSLVKAIDRRLPEPMKQESNRRLAMQVTELIGDRYHLSNTLTQNLIGRNITQYGYRIAKHDTEKPG